MVVENGIVLQIGHVDSLSFFFDLRMLTAQKPADVSKEESSSGIMWIGIGFAEFVMNSMVSSPFNYGILKQNQNSLTGAKIVI